MHSNPQAEGARVFLLGLGITALSALQSLVERFEVVGIVRDAPPAAAGRDEVIELSSKLDVPMYRDTSMPAVRTAIEKLQPDCVVVSSYNRILPADLLAGNRFVNVHYAPLPQYRGRANVNWAIINGEHVAAISIHRMVPGVDAGSVLFQETIPIRLSDTVATLYEQLNDIQRRALGETVARFLTGAEGEPQDESQATYGCTRLPDDGEIDWSWDTAVIDRLIRALVPPFPGAFTWFEGRRLIVHSALPVAGGPRYAGRLPGRIVAVSKTEGFVEILTGDGTLRLLEVQRPGEPRKTASSLIKSVKVTLGLRFADLVGRIERLEAQLGVKPASDW